MSTNMLFVLFFLLDHSKWQRFGKCLLAPIIHYQGLVPAESTEIAAEALAPLIAKAVSGVERMPLSVLF